MVERPIIFNSAMVNALLSGRKTQTRRVIKPQPTSIDVKLNKTVEYNGSPDFLMTHIKSPYGYKGDRLWVRWKPSIFMPRKLSRINLEVTDVRVQRVQDISRLDALAEGVNGGVVNSAVENFEVLWDSINGLKEKGWIANPWVWVVEFKVMS